MIRLEKEEQLLDIGFRKQIIEEIKAPENLRRKDEAFKRYQCYKNLTNRWVMKQLIQQFDRDTVYEMSYAISNLGISRKVIDKLARVYKYGVEREVVGDEAATEAIEIAEAESNVNQCFKKTNRFFKLLKNTPIYICPKPVSLEEDSKLTIKCMPLASYLYDVIELTHEREKPGCYILSDYQEPTNPLYSLNPAVEGRSNTTPQLMSMGNRRDEGIADRPEDQTRFNGYIFWSNSYHFTCDEEGNIISDPAQIDNPILEMPFVNFAEDQDGAFWAIGGNDLVDGDILINSMITNINHIGITQGYGQIVMTGTNLPKNLKVGPNKAVLLENAEGVDKSSFSFESANPPLDQLRALVEMYTALLLTTNNLSTSGVQTSLNSGAQFPSGIAMLIDKAESMEDVEDQRQIFIDNEPIFWDIYAKWHTLLKSRNELVEPLQNISFPDDMEISLKYGVPSPIQTEKEKLETLKMKKDLGLISMLDMIKEENPDISNEDAEKKLLEITEEKIKRLSAMMVGNENNGQQNNLENPVSDDRPGEEVTGED